MTSAKPLEAHEIDLVARVAHESNRAYCEAIEQEDIPPRWHHLNGEQRARKRNGVAAALEGKTPREMHEAWAKTLLEKGWTYGERVDEELKMHPNLKPYESLPKPQRTKDALFIGVVNAVAGGLR